MKKIISLILVLAFCVLFCACGTKSSSTKESQTNSSQNSNSITRDSLSERARKEAAQTLGCDESLLLDSENNKTGDYIFELKDEGKMYDEIKVCSLKYDSSKNDFSSEVTTKRKLHPTGIWGNSLEIISSQNGIVNIANYSLGSNSYTMKYNSYQICAVEKNDYDETVVGESLGDEDSTNSYFPYDYYVLEAIGSNGSLYAFDQHTLYYTKFKPAQSLYSSGGLNKEALESNTTEGLKEYLNGRGKLYGMYDEEYKGDVSETIVVPKDVVGKTVPEAIKYLQSIGFGEMEKYYEKPEVVDDIFCENNSDFSGSPISVIGYRFDKGSNLILFNHDEHSSDNDSEDEDENSDEEEDEYVDVFD